jgi:hypothetical protein
MSNCSMRDGALRRIIPAPHPVSSQSILTQRIEPNLQNNKNTNRKEHITRSVRNSLISLEIAVFEKSVPLLANGIVIRSGWQWCLVVA